MHVSGLYALSRKKLIYTRQFFWRSYGEAEKIIYIACSRIEHLKPSFNIFLLLNLFSMLPPKLAHLCTMHSSSNPFKFCYDLSSLSPLLSSFFFFSFCSTGFWTWGLVLARQVLYHLTHTFSPFCLFYFSDRVLCFLPRAGLGLQSSYLCFPSSWGFRCAASSMAPLLVLDQILYLNLHILLNKLYS
jgi:hypothetical protein